jgi:glycine cleavage system H protein
MVEDRPDQGKIFFDNLPIFPRVAPNYLFGRWFDGQLCVIGGRAGPGGASAGAVGRPSRPGYDDTLQPDLEVQKAMASPSACRFTESHEWFLLEGDTVTVGITQFAANELTDVTYVEMKPVGTTIEAGDSLGEVESVKTTSDVYCTVAGEIIEVNDTVADDPSLVNSDPFGAGWLVKLRTTNAEPLAGLMDQATYDAKHPVE